MFRIIRRLLGLASKPEPKRVPVVSPPDDPILAPMSWATEPENPAAARMSRITVCFPARREEPGTLKAFDAVGHLVSGPWPAVGKADPALAAAGGNPSCDRLQRFGDTPTGRYGLVGLLPAQSDARAVSRFGLHGILTLRPVSGEAAEADANGRTMLLIHGGDSFLAATDGSIRVPDPAMAEIIHLVPHDPSTLQPLIDVVVEDAAGHAEWKDADAAGNGWNRPWSRRRSENSSYTARDDGTDDDLDWWMSYYSQFYLWSVLDDLSPLDPAERLPWQSDEDRAAASALKAAGVDVQPDGQAKPAQNAGDPAAITPETLLGVSAASDTAPDQAPAAVEPSFQPSGGAYDR